MARHCKGSNAMLNPCIIGERLYLRPLEIADAPIAAAWMNDPEVARTLKHRPPVSLKDEENFILQCNQRPDELVLGIVLKDGDRLIGSTGLHRIDPVNRSAMFGILIGVKELWNQGHGCEATRLVVRHAFDTLNLHRVCLHVYEFNPAGKRVYEKIGFRQEGVLRQDIWRDGRYWDTYVMGLLRSEISGQ